jgi:penicillin amidase
MRDDALILPGKFGPVEIMRDEAGVAQIEAAALDDIHLGLGFCHARDRGLQMLLVRILGRGEASEKLRATDEMFWLDRFFRRLNFGGDAAAQTQALTPRARSAVWAYCEGVDRYFAQARLPWEFRWLGYAFEPWTAADLSLTAKITGYIALGQSQAEMERFIVECVQHGLGRDKLEELFPGQLNGLDEGLLRQVRLPERVIPAELPWAAAVPRMMASNNWVLAGSRTASGKPILCSDPHLEVNRLPAVWYEAVLRWRSGNEEHYAMGATMPGAPGVIVGRTRDLAWGVTYAFMDAVDSWIEECREGKCRRGEGWVPLVERREIIRRKKKAPVELRFYEGSHGTLAGDPQEAGYYLATRWSCGEDTSAAAVEAVCGTLTARTVDEGRHYLGRLSNSGWNWLLADRDGNIGYQMSGRMPKRRAGISGLVPLPGWEAANDWQGFVEPEELPRALNPPEGFIVTANQDLNHLGRVHPINLPMAGYRAERITALLAEGKLATVETMKPLQFDLCSKQAERFMAIIRPLLSEFADQHPESVRELKEWDLTYRVESKGAFVFEAVYRALANEAFGSPGAAGFGPAVLNQILTDTGLFNNFFGHFDRILLSESSAWYAGRSRTEVYRAALTKALGKPPEPYGDQRKFRMKHLVLGGKLPLFLGFDRAVQLPGNRATVHQTQVHRGARRETVFAPSFRLITDLATDEAHTALPGGPSDRRFSKWYANGISDWLQGRFKVVRGPKEA